MTVRDSRQRSPHLDVVRGLSILMVLFAHSQVHAPAGSIVLWPFVFLHTIGAKGVDVFFVLSGFLVGGLLLQEHQKTSRIRPRRFFVRRAFKVWPSYFAFLICFFAVQIWSAGEGATLQARAVSTFKNYWPNLLHVQNYFSSTVLIAPMWSLAVEEHFYLLLPWVLIFVLASADPSRTRSNALRMAVVLVAVIVVCTSLRALTYARTTASDDPVKVEYLLSFPTHQRIDGLFFGVFIAFVTQAFSDQLRRLYGLRHLLLLIPLAVGGFYYRNAEVDSVTRYPLMPNALYLAAGALVFHAWLCGFGQASLILPLRICQRAMAWLGMRSYAIYVWHVYFSMPIAHRIVQRLHLTPNSPGIGASIHDLVYLCVPIGLGTLMFHLVEKPGLRLRERIFPPTVSA